MTRPGGKARGSGRELSRDWRSDAACRNLIGPHFDPWDSDDRAPKPDPTAAHICGTCPVRRTCLIEAIAHDEPYGTWGGLTRRQRKALVRAQTRKFCPVCKASLLTSSNAQYEVCMLCGISWRTRIVNVSR